MNDDKAISVLVSVTEEADDLLDLHSELVTELDKLDEGYELLYLLGDATRRAIDQARRLQEQDPARVRVLQFAQTAGRAGMLSAGVERARGEVIFTVPARFEIDLEVIGDLHAAIRAGTDLAFASRTRGNVGISARMQSELFNRLVSLASGSRFRDVASETRALHRQVAGETPLYGDFYRYLPLLAERLGFRVQEIPAAQHSRATAPVVHAPRIYLWRAIDILSIFFISRFTRHPLRLFGGVGSAFAAVGFAILLIVALQRFAGTPLADRPVLVLGTLLVGLGVQAFTIGLLGELILFFNARSIRDYRITAVYEASPPPLEP
jgi:dolichol-phosphate mannosyltransferase